jgi:hypothetical protein
VRLFKKVVDDFKNLAREKRQIFLSLFLLFLCLCFRCRCLSHALSLCASPCALCEAIALLKSGRFIVRDFQMDEKEAASGEQDRKKLESDKETLQVRFEFTGRERESECAIVCCVRRCCCASRSSFLAPIAAHSLPAQDGAVVQGELWRGLR